MDVVKTVQNCILTWDKGGSTQCLSIVTSPHSNPADSEATDILTTTYQALLTSTLKTWPTNASLSLDTFVQFVQSVLERLPSSSANNQSSNATLFGELLVDLIWSLDAELEDVLSDARLAANAEQGQSPTVADDKDDKAAAEHAARLAKIMKAKENAESDKETLTIIVKKLLSVGVLDSDVCRERLDTTLIANAGLIPDKLTFEKKEIRTRTGLFYKQNKFNLLREQSEGFSKLTTEITSSLGPPHSPATGLPVEPAAAIDARAAAAWDRVLRLIGYFDLDPNRALDVMLDVFSVHLATHYRFFLSFLLSSPWSSRSTRQPSKDKMAIEPDPEQYRDMTLDEVLQLAELQSGYIAPSSPFSPNGSNSRVLAQVLGFKFTYYQSPEVLERTPKNLYLMAGLLIREGFITLEDLYSHITPTEAGMNDLHKKYLASVDKRISDAKVSQLAMAAPLESSGNSKIRPSPSNEAKKASEPKEIPNQKLGLLNALFSLGALRPAIALLSKFPWMVDAHPEVADLVLRVVKHSMQSLYDTTVGTKNGLSSFTQPRARYGASGVVSAPERRPQLTLWAPTPPSTSTVDFTFFFPDWTDRVPISSSLRDLVDVVEPLLRFIGLHISRDPQFLAKFLRLARVDLLTTVEFDPETRRPIGVPDPEHPIRLFWYKVLRLYLLPALPLIRGNAVCTVEVWNVLRLYETTQRWRLYGEWKNSTFKSHPELRVRQVQADRESKGILRRLSHNTIDSLSGTVAKLAHSNPCIFFANAVHQIMAYDNLGSVIVHALNYVTIMGFDVLLFIVLDALANPNKDRVKDDGVNTSDWLQSLASFTGMLFRRYSADLNPVLTYIVHQLYNGQTTELLVLKELIWKMAGIEPLPTLNNSQILAMAGGPNLRIEAVASTTRGARLDPGDAHYKGPQRLGRALLESSLALPLLIQVAQQRQSCVFKAANVHLKALASLFDTTHGVLLQFLELLNSPAVVSPQDYAQKIVPPLTELNKTYGISAPICMQIYRPILHNKLLTAALEAQDKERIASEEAEKRLKATLTAKREPGSANSRIPSPAAGEASTPGEAPSAQNRNGVVVENNNSADGVPMEIIEVPQNNSPGEESPWLPELYPLFDDIKKIAPGNAADVIGPGFYLTFWQMSTYDISPPSERYQDESLQLRDLSHKEDMAYLAADRSSDRAKRLMASNHRERRNRINTVVAALSEEAKQQTVSRMFTIKRLAREKSHWFAHGPRAHVLATSVIEHCLQPRCLLSPMDADYCSQMIKVIHLQGTPGFSTLMCYDKLLGEHVKVVIFSCSEYEAHNYGRFLHGILTDVLKWYKDEQLFMQDNRTKIGGKPTYLPGFQMKWTTKSVVSIEDIIKWADFKTLVKKWHRKLARNLLDCIETGEFMHVYNAFIVLKEILDVFPKADVNEMTGSSLDIAIDRFLEKEKRGDLKILGKSYSASLKAKESDWKAPVNAKIATPTPTVKPTPTAPAAHERPKPNGLPPAPATQTEARRAGAAPSTAPSAPRAQLAAQPSDRSTLSTKAAMESIPRPEVVKRVRPEARTPDGMKNGGETVASPKPDAMVVDSVAARSSAGIAPVRPSSPSTLPPLPKDIAMLREASRPSTPSSLSGRSPASLAQAAQTMPPPSIPSQTTSAQELRETARQTRPSTDKEEKTLRSVPEGRGQVAQPSPSLPPSQRRSPSPTSRPGTRNHSAESRASGGRARESTRGSAEGEDRRTEREGRIDTRRDHRGERSGRAAARESDREKDLDRDRERRDRHGDRERRDRDRERDRDKERERDRDVRDRERDRERDRDRDRDRHRRDDKDRERKDRDVTSRGPAPATAPAIPSDDRGLPSRPDVSRHRGQHGEDTLGKRRRPTDDDSDRASKRPSRKESHHEDRSRRAIDKDGHDRPSDRRRKDREPPEGESRALSIDTKMPEKRIPEGPASARALPPTTPSAPRAMSSGDLSRGPKSDAPGREREWRQRDQPPRSPESLMNAPTAPPSSEPGGSLRSRISDKEPSRSLQPAPSSYRAENGERGKPDLGNKDDDRDGGKKRTLSDRERDVPDAFANVPDIVIPPKRPKINRNRYVSQGASGNAHGLAKKLLPIDTEKARLGRKD
ncbi:unnamed protein product [Somion occarium]